MHKITYITSCTFAIDCHWYVVFSVLLLKMSVAERDYVIFPWFRHIYYWDIQRICQIYLIQIVLNNNNVKFNIIINIYNTYIDFLFLVYVLLCLSFLLNLKKIIILTNFTYHIRCHGNEIKIIFVWKKLLLDSVWPKLQNQTKIYILVVKSIRTLFQYIYY